MLRAYCSTAGTGCECPTVVTMQDCLSLLGLFTARGAPGGLAPRRSRHTLPQVTSVASRRAALQLLAQSPHSSANSGGDSDGGVSENGFDLILADHEPPKARVVCCFFTILQK